jgi:predicted ribosomally synthesized peptide with SipW-like signal peptide
MKKRIALVALSIVLVFSLAIGGTLMLFTAQSETATNVVTLGNIDADLQETEESSPVEADWKTIDGTYTGITFGPQQPGATLTKKARVANTGDNAFYAAIDGKITFKKGTTKLEWSEVTAIINETLTAAGIPLATTGTPAEKQAANNYKFLGLILQVTDADPNGVVDDNWFGSSIVATDAEFFGTWFYVEDADNLKSVASGAKTDSLFDGDLKIPLSLSDKAEGVTISLELTAYAVQSDNVTPGSTVAGWNTLFDNAR